MIKKFNKKCSVKKVFNPKENDAKILEQLYESREGLRVKTILKLTGLKERTAYKRLNKLKEKGLVYSEYPVWKLVNGEVKFVQSLLKNDKKVFELHHPAYVVRLLEIPKWWNPRGSQMRNKLMMVKGYQFQLVRDFGKNGSNPYIQLKSDRFVIQMYPESVIVIHRKRYHSTDPYELTINFMNDFYDLWAWFEERMKFKFFKDGQPQMTLRGHDYNRIGDWMAKYIIKKVGHKVLIDIGDGRKVWYDLSDPRGREANTPEMQRILENHTKDLILNKPKLNSELEKDINSLRTETLERIRDSSSDLANVSMVIKQMESNMRGQTELIYQLVEEIKKRKL